MASSWKEPHGHLPGTIDPIQLAERGVQLVGTLPLKSMPRLAQGSLEGSGDVMVDLVFERQDGEKVFIMHGELRVQLRVTCQRCLEAMDLELRAAPWLILMKPGERPARQEEDADTLLADRPVSLSEMVEDELLLVMPMVQMHEPNRCPARTLVAGGAGAVSSDAGGGGKNPFSVLSRLKKTK